MPDTKMKINPIKEVAQYGQSIWYDGLVSKEEFDRMIHEDGIRGATTNPTIFEKALSSGNYDRAIQHLSASKNAELIYKALAVKAVQAVADQFKPVFEATNGQDGFVSIEVSPLLAYKTDATLAEARELWTLVARPNAMIKVPATAEGIPAIEALIADGINVNVTLIFSLERYNQVMNAYLSGLEKRAAQKKPINSIASVASFFVSRVDTAVDKLLESKDKATASKFRGQVAIANSKVAYAHFEKEFTSQRFQKLKNLGAQIQRPLWASTGTKNPSYPDVIYVETLIGAHTVNTVPPTTLEAFRDHGKAALTIKNQTPEALETLSALKNAGIDLALVTAELESAGVKLFCDSYTKIIEGIKAKIK